MALKGAVCFSHSPTRFIARQRDRRARSEPAIVESPFSRQRVVGIMSDDAATERAIFRRACAVLSELQDDLAWSDVAPKFKGQNGPSRYLEEGTVPKRPIVQDVLCPKGRRHREKSHRHGQRP